MKRYILKRLVTAFFIVMVVIVLNFTIIKLAPGDPVRILAGDDTLTEEVVEAMTVKFGLDQPFHVQLGKYILNLLHGDLGTSFAYSQPVSMLIGERFGNSLLLSGTSAVLAVILGCWLGLYAGKNHGGLLDRIFSGMAYLFNSMPTFWLGMMGILLFASTLRWLPTQGMYNLRAGYTGMAYVGDVMVHMILPCASLVAVQIPAYFRITKTSVMQVMADDYIMTFRVTGMSERKIFRKYILKNAILPVLTVFGINLAYVVSGSTLTEIVFSWPGIGSLMYRSIMMRDYNVLMGVYLILALTVAAMMIIVDLVYAWLDPRIRYT